MDETYLLAAARYVEMNPLKAGLAEKADEYPFEFCEFWGHHTWTGILGRELSMVSHILSPEYTRPQPLGGGGQHPQGSGDQCGADCGNPDRKIPEVARPFPVSV